METLENAKKGEGWIQDGDIQSEDETRWITFGEPTHM